MPVFALRETRRGEEHGKQRTEFESALHADRFWKLLEMARGRKGDHPVPGAAHVLDLGAKSNLGPTFLFAKQGDIETRSSSIQGHLLSPVNYRLPAATSEGGKR